jgi:3-phenylpropionate/trans-cinnamate dioxygenase ferredoxin reductase subunit
LSAAEAVDLNARVVIVGAGHAGGSAAAFLRQYGHTGPITLIGDEPLLPYQRPPLSKGWLKGEADAESLSLKPAEWYEEAGVSLRLGGVVTRINRADQTVTLASGEILPYGYSDPGHRRPRADAADPRRGSGRRVWPCARRPTPSC